MPPAKRHAGFTLIEVSLAIVIGLIVVAGAVVLYQQVRATAQNSLAKEKLVSVAMLVEEMDARNYGLPSIDALKAMWKARRPDDYNVNPWGGALPDTNDFIKGDEEVARGSEIGDSPNGTREPSAAAADRGRIFYFRRKTDDGGRPYLWMPELSSFGADDPNAVYRMSGYGVGYVGPKGEQWFYVEGHGKTNASAASRLDVNGNLQD